jgi:hypothetical protein
LVGKFRRSGSVAAPLLALVLLFRLLVPVGYMIGPDSGGRPGLVLCAATAGTKAERTPHHGHDHNPEAPAPAEPGKIPCAYAALGAPPLPPAPPIFVPPALPEAPDLVAARVDVVARPALASPPPPSTGPPLPV